VDRETVTEYRLKVEALDGGSPPLSGSVDVLVRVLDANDHSPVFERQDYDVSVPEDVPRMTTIAHVRATDADEGENGRVTYSLGEATAATYGHQFSVDQDTGDVFVVAATGNFNATFTPKKLAAEQPPFFFFRPSCSHILFLHFFLPFFRLPFSLHLKRVPVCKFREIKKIRHCCITNYAGS